MDNGVEGDEDHDNDYYDNDDVPFLALIERIGDCFFWSM